MKVESPGMQEAAAGEDGGVFFCVAATSRGRKDRISYFQAEADGGRDAEAAARELAALCLDHAPEHHWWHHHTVDGRRTFAFLAADDGRTYFAVADPTPGSAETVRFLGRVRDAFNAASRRRLRDDAVAPVVRQFVLTLRTTATARMATMSYPMSGSASPGDSPGHPALAGAGKDEEDQSDVQPEAEGAGPWRRTRPSWTNSWWRYVKVAIAVDLVLLLVLFSVWMIVCNGFSCVQR